MLAEVKYLFLVHKYTTCEGTAPENVPKGKAVVFQEFEGHGHEKFSWGLCPPRPPHFPQSFKCLHPAVDQVKVSKTTNRKIRKIARLRTSSET